MSVREKRDYLYLIWKSKENRRQYIIGELSRNDSNYEFRYCDEVFEAQKEGFTPLVSFPELESVYCSKALFPVFESRLPDKKRKDMESILNKYELDEYEPYQLLKRSGGRLPIDNLYFVEPILEVSGSFKRKFHVAGARHYIGCKSIDCDKSLEIDIGEAVILEPEPTNKMDKYAVKVLNPKRQMLGYIPRYYSESIYRFIEEDRNVKCVVINVDKNKSCDECIKLLLEVE